MKTVIDRLRPCKHTINDYICTLTGRVEFNILILTSRVKISKARI